MSFLSRVITKQRSLWVLLNGCVRKLAEGDTPEDGIVLVMQRLPGFPDSWMSLAGSKSADAAEHTGGVQPNANR